MAKLLYQGHASMRITLNDGRVIYIDPYMGEGYDRAADMVLITHRHGDHNRIELVRQKAGCIVIINSEAENGERCNSFDFEGIKIQAVSAYNQNHDPKECTGYILTLDGVKLYISGDTSQTDGMKGMSELRIDYAFLCCDGKYNMDLEEAAQCARLIAAAHTVPVHIKAGAAFDIERANAFDAPNKLILVPGQELELTPA